MSQKNNDLILENLLISEHDSDPQKQLLLQKYLENPFSITWSKLAEYFSFESTQPPESDRFQQTTNSTQELDSYPHFMDRVDPSVYYTIFFPHQRF